MTEMSPAEEVFFAALEKDPANRAAYLDEACAGRPELRARVERLLAAHPKAGGFLDAPPAADRTGSLAAGEPDVAATRPGAAGAEGAVIAGRYKLLQQIGEGGMGVVWMADQTEPVKRRVAVKLIRAGKGRSGSILSRFEAERQAIALMDHPHIARLFDAGTAEDGSPYFVMELVKGVALTDYCDAHRLGIPERLGLFTRVCSAVQHAHQKGVIHRDLKPSNILVESHDGRPVPKVIDFGLAKATAEVRLTEHTLFTAFGSVMGTPLYMAPEQASFNAVDVDTRADVYALGVILYELLTGTTPLTRETVEKAALDEVLKLVRDQEAPTPSSRLSSGGAKPSVAANRQTEPAKLGRFVKGELDWIVLKALAKERDRRYESATGLASDVERFLNHDPVTAGPPTAGYRLRKFVRRNRGRVVAASLLLAVLLLGLLATSYGFYRAGRERDRAEGAERSAVANALAAGDAAEAERQAKLTVQEEKAKTETQLTRAERLLYAARLAAAQRAWDDNQVALAADHLDSCRWDVRGWEHAYLHSRFRSGQAVLGGHSMSVQDACFSPDGKWIATASNNRVHIRDAATGRERRTLEHPGAVLAVCFSPDGKLLAVAGLGKVVRVWDTNTWGEHRNITGLQQYNSLAFSPDSARLAGCGLGARIQVWNVESAKDVLTLRDAGACLSFSPDGTRLLAALNDSTARVWDAATGAEVVKVWQQFGVRGVSWSPDGTKFAAGGGIGPRSVVKLWDAVTGKEVRSLGPFRSEVRAVCFSPDGRVVATAGGTPHGVEEVRLWDASAGDEVLALRGHTDQINTVRFSPDGSRLITSSDDRTARVWDRVRGQQNPPFPIDPLRDEGDVAGLDISPDGGRIVSGCGDGTIYVWDTTTKRQKFSIRTDEGLVRGVAFDRRGTRIAAGVGWAVWVVNAETGEVLHKLKTSQVVRAVAFTPDGRRVVAGTGFSGSKGELLVWDAATGETLPALAGHPSPVVALAFNADGSRLATASEGGRLQGNTVFPTPGEWSLWAFESGNRLLTGRGHARQIEAVCFTPDGKRVVTGGDDRTVRVWDAESGGEVLVLRGHSAGVRSLCCLPGGTRLVSGGGDYTGPGEIKVWDLSAGQEVLTLRGHAAWVRGLAITPDGQRLYSAAGGVRQPAEVWEWAAELGAKPLAVRADDAPEGVAFTDGGSRIVVRGRTGRHAVYDATTGYRADAPAPADTATGKGAVSTDGTRKVWIEGRSVRVSPEPGPENDPQRTFEQRLAAWAEPDAEWHRQQATASESSKHWFAAVFHLRHALRAAKGDPTLTRRLETAQANLLASAKAPRNMK